MLMKAEPPRNPSGAPGGDSGDVGTPMSTLIRERIQAARKRFHANDNIADFIQPGEMEQLLDEVEAKMQLSLIHI